MAPSLALLVLGLPALLAGAAAMAGAAGRGARARTLCLAAAAAALVLAAAAPAGPFTVPWLLLGATGGVDLAGRIALVAAAAVVAPALRRISGEDPGGLGWRALLAAGLAAGAVALDAGTLSIGLVAAVAGAYGLARRASPRAADVFVGFAVLGQVLLVDALGELGHAAESARLDAIRAAASAEAGGLAAWLLVAAFGLPLALAGTGGAPSGVVALGVLGVTALVRVGAAGGGPGEPLRSLVALAAIGVAAAVAGRILARRLAARGPGAKAHAAHDHGGEVGPREPSAAVAAAGAWLDAGERRILAAGASGALLLALVVALALALAG